MCANSNRGRRNYITKILGETDKIPVFFNVLNIHLRNPNLQIPVTVNPHKSLALRFDKKACVPHTPGIQTGVLETGLK